jgi:hypothetical protein
MNSHQPLLRLAALITTWSATAAVVSQTYTFTVGAPTGTVSDSGIPLTLSQTIAGSGIATLTEVRVGLNLHGTTAGAGWAGDLFVSLNRAGTATSVLLNQAGVDGSNPAGFGYDGWNVTFRDTAANGDIHVGQPGGTDTLLAGEWQPDGRQDPTSGIRSALLAVFNGVSPNAAWHLTLADLNPSGTMLLESWSLTFTGLEAVPEPGATALAFGAGLIGFAIWRRQRRYVATMEQERGRSVAAVAVVELASRSGGSR